MSRPTPTADGRRASLTPQEAYHTLQEESSEPVTKRELNSWLLYDWANGPYFYTALTFFPLVITSQAKEMAKVNFCGNCPMNEWAVAFETDGTCSSSSYSNASSCEANGHDWDAKLSGDANTVNLLGMEIGYASFPLYCTVLSVIIQLIIYVTMGSFADYGPNRKRLLIVNTYIGILATCTIFFTGSASLYWFNGLLYIISVVGFNFAVVFYNAYLPVLVEACPEVLEARAKGQTEVVKSLTKQLTHFISLKGLATGFTGQLIYLIMTLVMLNFVTSENQWGVRISIGGAGIWVLLFSLVTFRMLKTRPAPDLPKGESYCSHGLHGAVRTFKSFRKLKELGKFLIAYFIFSDGTSTMAGAALVFGQEELNMTSFQIGLAMIEVTVLGIIGCVFFKWLNEKHHVHSKTILLINLSAMTLIPIYSMFAMTNTWEFFISAGVFGFNTASQQAFTRSIYAHALPTGRESEYFAFYELSDKGTAWLGPLVLGLVFEYTGSYRDSFGTLVGFFVLGMLLLLPFKPERAEVQKLAFEKQDVEHHHESVARLE